MYFASLAKKAKKAEPKNPYSPKEGFFIGTY